MNTIKNQLHDNAVAIISLIVAIIALGHDAWRSEISEENRNIRISSFEVLRSLGQLQVVVNSNHYGNATGNINPMNGWGYIALIGDLSKLIPEPVPQTTQQLLDAWARNWQEIQTNEEAVDAITEKIDASRSAVLKTLSRL